MSIKNPVTSINIRFPARVHVKIKKAAARDRRSLNQWVVVACEAFMQAASRRGARKRG